MLMKVIIGGRNVVARMINSQRTDDSSIVDGVIERKILAGVLEKYSNNFGNGQFLYRTFIVGWWKDIHTTLLSIDLRLLFTRGVKWASGVCVKGQGSRVRHINRLIKVAMPKTKVILFPTVARDCIWGGFFRYADWRRSKNCWHSFDFCFFSHLGKEKWR